MLWKTISYETLAPIYHTMQHQMPENHNLRRKNWIQLHLLFL